MTFAARLLLAMNRILPRPIESGDTADAYSQWEYDTGRDVFERYFAPRVAVAGATWLDIGCGTGGKAAFYATQRPRHLIAIDILEANATQAKAFARDRNASETNDYVVADAARLPFRDASFDVVSANDAFEHFTDPSTALQEITRVLRPGGHALFNFPPFRSPLGAHLYEVLRMPWCHLLFREPALFEAIEREFLEEEKKKGTNDPDATARSRAQEMRESYHRDLNRMSIARFLSMVREVPDMDVVWFYRKPMKTPLLAPLTRVPSVGELVTTLAVGILTKRA